MDDAASLVINVDARDVGNARVSLDQLAAAGGRVEASTKKSTNAATELARSYRQTSSEAGLLERNVGSLSGAFGLLGTAIAAIGLASFASEAVRLADAYTNMRGRLAQVTTGTAQLSATMEALFDVAQRSRTGFEATAMLYGNLARATQGFGAKQSELLKVTEAINQSFVISGASAASAEAALVQLSQGFASGALRGDELNSVLEQSPRLAKAIADALGVTVGQLRKLGEEGKLAGREIFEGIGSQAVKIAEEYAKMPLTIGQAFIQLRNGILKYVGEIDQANGVSGAIAKTISGLSGEIDRVARAFAGFAVSAALMALPALLGTARTAMLALNAAVRANPFVAAASVVLGLATALYTFKDATITVGNTTAQVGDFIVAAWNVTRDGVTASIDTIVNAMPAIGTAAEGTTADTSNFFSDAFSFIGNVIKDSINGWIGGMVAAGVAAAAVAVGMVRYFGEGFAKVKAMAVGFGQGLAGIFAGDFSFSAFNGALAMTRTSLADVGASLSIARVGYQDYVGALFNAYSAETDAVRGRREAREVTNGLTDATGALTAATNEATEADKAAARAKETATKEAQAFLDALQKETSEIGKSATEIKAMEVAAAAAAAPTLALRDAILAAGLAWETATVARAAFEDGEQAAASLQDLLTGYERQAQLIGQTAEAQAILNAEFAIADLKIKEMTPAMQAMVDKILALAAANGEAEKAAGSLLRELSLIDDLAYSAGRGLSDAFGDMGDAIGGVTVALTGMLAQQEAIRKAMKDKDIDEAQGLRELSSLRVRSYGDAASAAKDFFEEGTAGYDLMLGAERAFRIVEFGLAAQAIALKMAEATATVAAEGVMTSATLAGTAVRTPAKAAEGIAGIFAALGPFGFPVAAAAIAVMVGAGVKAFSGGGAGGAAPVLPTTNSGTGTVLGETSAESQSISRSLEMAERYQDRDLDFSSKMVSSLKVIETNIGAVTTSIARQLGVGGGLDPSNLSLGSSTVGASGLMKLFSPLLGSMLSTTRTRELAGQGLDLNSGSLGGMLSGGVSGSIYNLIQNTKTKSGFLGIGGGTTTWQTEERSAIDGQLSAELTRLLGSLRSGVLAAAGELGVTGAEATLDALTISLGRIDFAGLSSSEIGEKLSAVFSAAGDQMAAAILPQLATFQKAGEGMFETLTRLATTFRAVDTTLASIGMTFGAVGLDSLAARDRLVELSGGLDAFIEGADFFAENFLSDAQRIAPIQAAVTAELQRLGVASDISRTQFADLVMGLDVSTTSGAEMFAALMRLAPAIDQTLAYAEELTGVVTDLGNAADIARQRHSLELALMEAQGNSAGALAIRRADELAAMDASLRPLQELIWTTNDIAEAARLATAAQEEAARAAQAIADQRRSMEITLMELTGDASGALAARRAIELSGMDASLQALQRLIYAQTDLNAVNEAAATAANEAAQAAIEREQLLAQYRAQAETDALALVEKARDALSAAYEREAGAIQTTIDKFRGFEEGLRRFRESLGLEGLSPGASLAVSKQDFERTSALARVGNEQALGDLQGVSEAYLEQSRAYSKTSLDHLRNLSSVREAVQAAEATAGRQASIGEQQLAALNGSVEGLMVLNGSVLSVRDAISALASAQAVLSSVTPTVANDNREWGVNPEVNRLLARQTGYAGDFGSGGFDAWIRTQDEAVKAGARATLAAQGQAYRIGFATGGSFEVGGSGGTDSTPISFMATPGEMVNIRRPGDNDNSEMVAELRDMNARLARLESAANATAGHTGRTARAVEDTRDDVDFVVNGAGTIKTVAA